MKDAVKESTSGLGLESIGDLSGLLDAPEVQAGNAPAEIPLDLIDEDPNQPRRSDNPGFAKTSLEELARTIRDRKVKSPISVRENPDEPGRFIINHGARRYRASRIAGKETIPAYIDNDYSEADQVIENLQRNELTAREIADFVGRELAKGVKKGDIAASIGKSPAFVSQHVTLLDLPEPIAEAFNTGRVSDVTVVNELVKAYKKDAQAVVSWLSDEDQEITRGGVKILREYVDDKKRPKGDDDLVMGGGIGDPEPGEPAGGGYAQESEETPGGGEGPDETPEKEEQAPVKAPSPSDPDKLKSAIVFVKHDERMARLLLKKRPGSEGWAWLKYEDDGEEFEADLGEVTLMAVVEG